MNINNNRGKLRKNNAPSNVRDTSKESHNNNEFSGKNEINKRKVLNILPKIQPATRMMIAVKLDIASSTLGFPIGELIKEQLVFETYKAPCKETGCTAWYLSTKNDNNKDENK